MSEPIEPRHDAPLCNCGEGVLVPVEYRDGNMMRPQLPGADRDMRGWSINLMMMSCSGSGEEFRVDEVRALQAWWSVGAQEQYLIDEPPAMAPTHNDTPAPGEGWRRTGAATVFERRSYHDLQILLASARSLVVSLDQRIADLAARTMPRLDPRPQTELGDQLGAALTQVAPELSWTPGPGTLSATWRDLRVVVTNHSAALGGQQLAEGIVRDLWQAAQLAAILADPRMDGTRWIAPTDEECDAWPWWESTDWITHEPFIQSGEWLRSQVRMYESYRPLRLPGMNARGEVNSRWLSEAYFARVKQWQWRWTCACFAEARRHPEHDKTCYRWHTLTEKDFADYLQQDWESVFYRAAISGSGAVCRPAVFAQLDEVQP